MKHVSELQVGDPVTRLLGGKVAMDLVVTEVSDELITCGAWTFDRNNGAEIDVDLGWDMNGTGSYITAKE